LYFIKFQAVCLSKNINCSNYWRFFA